PQSVHDGIGDEKRGPGAHAQLPERFGDAFRGVRAEPDAARAPERAGLLEEHVRTGHPESSATRAEATWQKQRRVDPLFNEMIPSGRPDAQFALSCGAPQWLSVSNGCPAGSVCLRR